MKVKSITKDVRKYRQINMTDHVNVRMFLTVYYKIQRHVQPQHTINAIVLTMINIESNMINPDNNITISI